jgi:hypothetical protein
VDSSFRDRLGRKLYREVDKYVHDGKKKEYQVQALVEFFDLNSNDFTYFVGKENTTEGDVVYTHISWIDKRFSHFKSQKQYKVFSKDVTLGVTDSSSGFDKLSTISALSADHTVDPLCFTVLVSETKSCFIDEVKFFMPHYSWLQIHESKSTWFVDGDRANISAVEDLITQDSTVVLCLYHFTGTYRTTTIHWNQWFSSRPSGLVLEPVGLLLNHWFLNGTSGTTILTYHTTTLTTTRKLHKASRAGSKVIQLLRWKSASSVSDKKSLEVIFT